MVEHVISSELQTVTRHEQNVFYEKYKIKTELEVTYIWLPENTNHTI